MKIKTMACILVCSLALILTACRADETGEPLLSMDPESAMIEDAYPAGDAAYPIGAVFAPVDESAYPIRETDLAWLLQIWRLESYTKNGIESKPPLKVLSINADGSYSIATETELEQGSWSTILLAAESTLILTPESGEIRYYQIIDLGEDVLNLQTIQGADQIDEKYLPDDSSCGCV